MAWAHASITVFEMFTLSYYSVMDLGTYNVRNTLLIRYQTNMSQYTLHQLSVIKLYVRCLPNITDHTSRC